MNFINTFQKNVNGVRLKLYNSINNITDIDKIYYSICKDMLDNLVGNEIAMQKNKFIYPNAKRP